LFGAIGDKLLKVFESLVMWFYESLIEPFTDLPTLKNLVFGKYKEDELVWGTFNPSDLTNGFGPLFSTMATLSGFVMVALIVVYGIRISGAPMNPTRRNEGIEFIKDLVFVGLVLLNLPTLYDLLFSINSSVVNLFAGAYTSEIDNIKMEDFLEGGETSGVIGVILVQLVLLGLAIWANFYYLMRKVTLIILMSLGPLMIVFWLNPKFKSLTGAFFRELVGSIFVQSIHSFVFWTVAVISVSAGGLIETVIVYVIFIPISESMRRLLNMGGDMQGGLSKAGAMMGMAGLAGMAGAVKGAVDGKGVTGSLKNAYDGVKNNKGKDNAGGDDLKNTVGANAGGDSGTSTRADKMLRSGDIVGKMGKATLGMAGAVAGMGLGPVGAMAGASAGFAVGGVAGGVAGRLGAGAIQGIGSRISKGMGSAKEQFGKGSHDFGEDLANEVADRSTASWADGNKESEMSQLRQRFPNASQGELDSKFDAIKGQKRAAFHSDAKQHIEGSNMMNGKNPPADSSGLAVGLASSKTQQMGNDFVEDQMAQGVDRSVAKRDWKQNHHKQAYASNLEMFKGGIGQASDNAISAAQMGGVGKRIATSAGAFALRSTGITGGLNLAQGGYEAIADGGRAFVASNSSNMDINKSGLRNAIGNVIPSAKAGMRSMSDTMAEQRGGAVAAQAGYQENTAYASGLILGVGGYQAAKKIANKITPYQQSVQSAISSPGEVIQMAQKTTDGQGNQTVATGAIRQVTTSKESFIEVTTQGGEKQIVSRKGSGHSGMRQGDVVYQDLTASGDSLVPSATGTYRIDSAGGRAASSVQISSNPSSLLGDARVGDSHKSVSRAQTPVFSQSVDTGKFYSEDLGSNGMSNVQVVVEKDRQYMTAQKEGVTYRVSPVMAGDSRIQGNQQVQVPVTVEGSNIVAQNTAGTTFSVDSKVITDGTPSPTNQPYVSSTDISSFLQSKFDERASRSVEQRNALDDARRKQGFLG